MDHEDATQHAPAPLQPHRFRIARDLRELTQTEVVKAMREPISVAALSQIEAGKIRPSGQTVRGLADALDVPPAFFRRPVLEGHDAPTAPYFRDLRSTPSKLRRHASALATVLGDFLEVLSHRARLPQVDLSVDLEGVSSTPEGVAERVRKVWGLGDGPIPDLVRVLERRGIVVVRLALGGRSVDAFATNDRGRPIIFLADDKHNYVRSRFDAAHELGHLVLHSGSEDDHPNAEKEAHEFASTLLFPREAALAMLPRSLRGEGWTRLAQLKLQWGISIAAMLFAGRKLGIYDEASYTSGMRYMSSKGWRKDEPGDQQMGPPETGSLLERTLKELQLRDQHSLERFLWDAALPVRDLAEVVRSSRDSRPAISV